MLHLIIRSIAICYPKVVLHLLLLLLEGWTSSSRRKSKIASATRSFAASWKRPENSHFSSAWKSIWARFFCNVKYFILLEIFSSSSSEKYSESNRCVPHWSNNKSFYHKKWRQSSSLCVSLIYLNNFCVFHVEKKIYKQSDIFFRKPDSFVRDTKRLSRSLLIDKAKFVGLF